MTSSSTTLATSPAFCCASQLAGNTDVRRRIAVMSRSGATASITSDSIGERMSIAPNDTMNSRMFATPIGRNCRKPCSNATSDEARLTSWPVWSSSWLAKSRRWSWRNTAVRRSCCTSSAMRPPRNRRKYANTKVMAPIAIINASHGASGRPGSCFAAGVITSSTTTFCTTGSNDWISWPPAATPNATYAFFLCGFM